MNNFSRYFLGAFLGLLTGLLIVQTLYYFESGEIVPVAIQAGFSIRDYVIFAGLMAIGIFCGHVFIVRDMLATERMLVVSLEQAVEKKNKLIGYAAHAMRTPATGLKWALEELHKGTYGALSKDQNRMLDDSENTLSVLLSLIENYLDISNFEVHNLKILLKQVSVGALCEELRKTIAPLRHRAELKHVEVTYVHKPNGPQDKFFVLADLERLVRAFENVLENAVEYTPPRGKVTVVTAVTKNNFVCQISDTGIGIREEDKAKIFSEFFRSANAQALKSAGSGIGLFLTRIIVDAHQGKIWFDSEENKGSDFYISIPLRNPKETTEFEEFLRQV